jgi:hypothetical protein
MTDTQSYKILTLTAGEYAAVQFAMVDRVAKLRQYVEDPQALCRRSMESLLAAAQSANAKMGPVSADQQGASVVTDDIAQAVKESIKHLDGFITARGGKHLVAQFDELICKYLERAFVSDFIGQAKADGPAEVPKVFQNLLAFNAHTSSKRKVVFDAISAKLVASLGSVAA